MIHHYLNSVSSRFCSVVFIAAALLLLTGWASVTLAQTEDAFNETAADPVKLFERAQNAHARGDRLKDRDELLKALELYDEAIKVRPEFPEAEFQRGSVLVSLERLAEADASFRRAIALRQDWPLPYSMLGILLVRLNRDIEAEPFLRQALKLDSQSGLALRVLADIRFRAGDAKEALELARRATNEPDAPVATWILRALAERAVGDKAASLASLDHALQIEPANLFALIERAEMRIAIGDKEHALEDLKAAEPLIKDGEKGLFSRLANAYDLAGKPDEARRIAQSAGLIQIADGSSKGARNVRGTPEEIEAANSDDPIASRKALEQLLQKNPDSAMLLARLGASYRTVDPFRSAGFYRRALKLQPSNADYATGYSSALVQARRFADAVAVLRRAIIVAPDNYAAHANLATALYELKQYTQALVEYEWLLKAKPDLAVAHYFIATAHDYLGEYQEALAAYENFLERADQKTNQLEIEKVRLRLPSLRRQIKLGQGVKPKPGPTKNN
jgi:tetratricopeptide (TPR) repeat protein